MTDRALERVFREASARIIGVLAARYRDLDLAEDAFADACAKAVATWADGAPPDDPAAWLYRIAERRLLDELRRRRVRSRLVPDAPLPMPDPEALMLDEARVIPDERLRLIFVCCHPAIAVEARAALTLRLVCGLSLGEIARAFLVSESALAQRLVRAKRKIAEAGIAFEVPEPEAWAERLDAVLASVEIAYAKAHEDAAGTGPHAGFASEMLALTRVLAELMPKEADVLALAALIRFAEARRPARVDAAGLMVPLSDQDPAHWSRVLIDEAERYFEAARVLGRDGVRLLHAAIHRAWCRRRSLAEPPPWADILGLYDRLLVHRDDAVIRLNRIVALAEVEGLGKALASLEALEATALADYLPYHALRADLLRRLGRAKDARDSYDRALALEPNDAERRWLDARLAEVSPGLRLVAKRS